MGEQQVKGGGCVVAYTSCTNTTVRSSRELVRNTIRTKFTKRKELAGAREMFASYQKWPRAPFRYSYSHSFPLL